mgnify:CR=1 FL=1
MESKPSLNDQLRQAAVERMWLNYYNNTLLEQGLISKDMHRKMKLQLAARKPHTPSP